MSLFNDGVLIISHLQSPLLLPSVPEVSLSLSFDESSFSQQNGRNKNRQGFPAENQPILPGKDDRKVLPMKKDDKVILKRNPKILDQENRGDPRHVGKQVMFDRKPVNSPQREPLKPVSGQVNHAQTPPSQVPGIEKVPGPKGDSVPFGKGHAHNKAINGGHSKAPGNAPKAKGPPMKGPKDVRNGRGRGPDMNPRENQRTDLKYRVQEIQDVGAQGKSVMTRQASHEDSRVPLVDLQGQDNPRNEQENPGSAPDQVTHDVIEQDGNRNNVEMTNGKVMDSREDEQRLSFTKSKRVLDSGATRIPYVFGSSQDDHYHHNNPSDAGINDHQGSEGQIAILSKMPQTDTMVFHQHKPIDQGINSKQTEPGMNESVFSDSGVGDSTRDTIAQHDKDDNALQVGGFSSLTGQYSGKKDAANETREDPYDLIMRQQQQLQELQQQVFIIIYHDYY